MTWDESGRKRSWWIDSNGRPVVHWSPIISEVEDVEEGPNPLDLLTHKQRFVVELRCGWVDGCEYSQREIATLMGISRSMVNQHEQAAKKKLSKYLRRTPAPQTKDGE